MSNEEVSDNEHERYLKRESEGWPVDAPIGRPSFDQLLVVLDHDVMLSDEPREAMLMRRVRELASATGCAVELYVACLDDSLGAGFFLEDRAVEERRQEVLDLAATRASELGAWLHSETGAEVTHLARWEEPNADTILERIDQNRPDVVIKASSGSDYLIGLVTNTDWELIRRSPVPIWFVTGERTGRLGRLLTALGTTSASSDIVTATDYKVCALAKLIASATDAENTILHTYQIPQGIAPYAAYAPEIAAVPPPVRDSDRVRERALAEKHGDAIRAFARYFLIDPEKIRIQPGRLSQVAPATARELDVDLIVMGARNLSRLQRALYPVNAEPVLADAPCDVLILGTAPTRPAESSDVPEGSPQVDLEEAIVNPERVFGTPSALARHPGISLELRRRLLKIWESDIRAEMREEDEGGVVRGSRGEMLQNLNKAREDLEQGHPGDS
jgi:universal stress protein E